MQRNGTLKGIFHFLIDLIDIIFTGRWTSEHQCLPLIFEPEKANCG
jgi:hypothetical protein